MKLESTGITHIYSTGAPTAKPDAIQCDKDGNEIAHWRFNPPAPRQEPVAFRNIETGEFCTGGFLRGEWAKWQPLYTAPPKREWVGLTDEDIDLYAFDEGVTDNKAPAWLVTYARGIEAKLKEKNT